MEGSGAGREAKGPLPGTSGRRIDRVLSSGLSERFETQGREKRNKKEKKKEKIEKKLQGTVQLLTNKANPIPLYSYSQTDSPTMPTAKFNTVPVVSQKMKTGRKNKRRRKRRKR